MPVLQWLAGSLCLPPHPPHSPQQPTGWWDSPGITVVGSRRFACVRALFALPGWTCLYLLKELGDTCCWESWPAVPTPCLRPSKGLTSPTFGQDPTSLPTLLGPARSGHPCARGLGHPHSSQCWAWA